MICSKFGENPLNIFRVMVICVILVLYFSISLRQSAKKRLAHFDCLRLTSPSPPPPKKKSNVDPAHIFCGLLAKVANIDCWGRGRIKLNVNVLSVVSKFIDDFQPRIFETVNNIVKGLKCANSFLFANCSIYFVSYILRRRKNLVLHFGSKF